MRELLRKWLHRQPELRPLTATEIEDNLKPKQHMPIEVHPSKGVRG